jgi:hypothetical protein
MPPAWPPSGLRAKNEAAPIHHRGIGAVQIDVERLVCDTHRTATQLDRFPIFAPHQLVVLKSGRHVLRGRRAIVKRRLVGFNLNESLAKHADRTEFHCWRVSHNPQLQDTAKDVQRLNERLKNNRLSLNESARRAEMAKDAKRREMEEAERRNAERADQTGRERPGEKRGLKHSLRLN